MESDNTPSYTINEIKQIYTLILPYLPVDYTEEHYNTLEDFKKHPLTYEILTQPLESIPLYSNIENTHVRELTKWRMMNNK